MKRMESLEPPKPDLHKKAATVRRIMKTKTSASGTAEKGWIFSTLIKWALRGLQVFALGEGFGGCAGQMDDGLE